MRRVLLWEPIEDWLRLWNWWNKEKRLEKDGILNRIFFKVGSLDKYQDLSYGETEPSNFKRTLHLKEIVKYYEDVLWNKNDFDGFEERVLWEGNKWIKIIKSENY